MRDKDLRKKALQYMQDHKVRSNDIDYIIIGTSPGTRFDRAMSWSFIGVLMFFIAMICDRYALLPGTLFFSAITIFTSTVGAYLLFGQGSSAISAVVSVAIVLIATICTGIETCTLEVSATLTVNGTVDMMLDYKLGAIIGSLFSMTGVYVANLCSLQR